MNAKILEITNRPKLNTIFWSKVNKLGPIPDREKYPDLQSNCWQWTGYSQGFGYGKFNDGGPKRHIYAHRYSWIFTNGKLRQEDSVLHKCDNPKCVNPEHLFLGSLKDNQMDALRKGRRPIGERVNTAKLNESQVRLIRRCHALGIPNTFLGKLYGMPRQSIRSAAIGQSWKHLKTCKSS